MSPRATHFAIDLNGNSGWYEGEPEFSKDFGIWLAHSQCAFIERGPTFPPPDMSQIPSFENHILFSREGYGEEDEG
jgi:hypothetical protein